MSDKSNDEKLFESKYIGVYKRDGWYEYMHNRQGNGAGVMVLVYNLSDPSNPKILGRYEHTPCHSMGYETKSLDKPCYLTSITGQMDKRGKSAEEVALEELREEAGITGSLHQLESLGYVYPSKASDTMIKLFAFDGSKSQLGEITGDGSRGEKEAYVNWEAAHFAIEHANCPMIGMAYLRLLNKKLLENFFKEKI